jgi:peroxiredoxin
VPGISERAVFVVDKRGRIAYAKVYPIDRAPETEEVFEVLRKL